MKSETYVELTHIARHQFFGIFSGFARWDFARWDLGASVAQLAEQLICNQQVVGSSPSASSYVFLYRSGFSWKVSGCLRSHFATDGVSGKGMSELRVLRVKR